MVRRVNSLPPLPKLVHFLTQSSNFVTHFLELPHDFVHRIAFLMALLLTQFPLGGVRSFRDMLGDIVESRVIQMLDSDPHVFQAACDLLMRTRTLMVQIVREFP
jgi:hypothetical protein